MFRKLHVPRFVRDYALVAFIAMLVVGWFARRPAAPVFDGDAPPIHLTGTDGQTFDLAQHIGQPVLLVFWAEWCGVCQTQVKDLNRLHADRADVAILGIAVDSGDNDAVKIHARKHGIDFPVAATVPGVTKDYQVSALPTNIFIDAQGNVTDAVVGALNYAGFQQRL
ncbi:MAG: TlpA family protein disulfide reductase [Oligoflexia bacterium]|nr:TlpA family protein disulfide reductase [Oligoflexia bacterium]